MIRSKTNLALSLALTAMTIFYIPGAWAQETSATFDTQNAEHVAPNEGEPVDEAPQQEGEYADEGNQQYSGQVEENTQEQESRPVSQDKHYTKDESYYQDNDQGQSEPSATGSDAPVQQDQPAHEPLNEEPTQAEEEYYEEGESVQDLAAPQEGEYLEEESGTAGDAQAPQGQMTEEERERIRQGMQRAGEMVRTFIDRIKEKKALKDNGGYAEGEEPLEGDTVEMPEDTGVSDDATAPEAEAQPESGSSSGTSPIRTLPGNLVRPVLKKKGDTTDLRIKPPSKRPVLTPSERSNLIRYRNSRYTRPTSSSSSNNSTTSTRRYPTRTGTGSSTGSSSSKSNSRLFLTPRNQYTRGTTTRSSTSPSTSTSSRSSIRPGYERSSRSSSSGSRLVIPTTRSTTTRSTGN